MFLFLVFLLSFSFYSFISEIASMSISSMELRQRKATSASPAVDRNQDDLKKQKQYVKPAAAAATNSNDALIAFALFVVSLPIRFKNLGHPGQVV